MGIVSYAQNFEDVMLWRLFRGVKDGFYLDIGAHNSRQDSVSLSFYENGWTGIDVEPVSEYAEQLRQDRPRNIVLEAVITDAVDDVQNMYCIPGTGLSTLDPDIAQEHEARGFEVIIRSCDRLTLDDVFALCTGDVHWAKVDVEGHEKHVINSWKSEHRPWALLIESVSPINRSGTELEWEYMLFEKGYKYVWFDGLNRFYLHQEHLDKISCFSAPPNLFDEFQLSGEGSSTFHSSPARQAELASKMIEAGLAEAAQRQVALQQRVDELEADRARILEEHALRLEEFATATLAREAAFVAEISKLNAQHVATRAQARKDQRAAAANLEKAREQAAGLHADYQRKLEELEADRVRLLGEQSARFEQFAKLSVAREELASRERDERVAIERDLLKTKAKLEAVEMDLRAATTRISEFEQSVWWRFMGARNRKMSVKIPHAPD
jgi:FkbM family methyltransferase